MLLRVVDLETTGVEPPAAVCEIGWTDVVARNLDLAGYPTDWQVDGGPFAILVDPGCPIPPETSAIHHIVDEDVVGAPKWPEAIATALAPRADGLKPAALVAHSSKFERAWLTDDVTGGLPWICTYKCALRLWDAAPRHSNQALRYWRRPVGLDRAIANVAHRAGPDSYVTAFHVRDLLGLAPLQDLIAWSSEPALQVTCHIGKWRGTAWREVDYGFLEWVSARDFDEDVIFTVRHEIKRRQDEWEAERRESEAAEAESDSVPF